MKLFISADIEGCAGLALPAETHKNESIYQAFAKEMTEEVIAACEAAHEAGADEIVVKDGHGDASNIDPLKMPEYVTLIRGKSGHPYNMMYGIDDTFDGVLFIGYHAPAGNPEFSISHTSTGNSLYIHLNGKVMSECMLNSYTAASHNVPILFLSGDEEICRLSKELIPGITTVATKHGEGAATWCVSAKKIQDEIRKKVKAAVSSAGKDCHLTLPEHFTYEVTYKDWKKAYTMSFYPGMEKVDTFTNKLETDRWMDVVTAHCFVVY
ncbi:MAG: M55 family metallopeptidase [Fusicatenibacter sp.]|nr:M55 family metallopeptidase [Lachnospiraceae bacterium]MDY2937974.1 M55 family metallopeptidase [Fusicatenibacter sp.]